MNKCNILRVKWATQISWYLHFNYFPTRIQKFFWEFTELLNSSTECQKSDVSRVRGEWGTELGWEIGTHPSHPSFPFNGPQKSSGVREPQSERMPSRWGPSSHCLRVSIWSPSSLSRCSESLCFFMMLSFSVISCDWRLTPRHSPRLPVFDWQEDQLFNTSCIKLPCAWRG